MKRFKFRLERLERWRLTLKRESESRLASANAALHDCRERREGLDACARDAEDRWGEASTAAAPDVRSLRLLSGYLEGLQSALTDHAPLERRAEARVATCESEHVERSRAHRALEKLRERKWRRWLDEAATFEQRFLDEQHLARVAASRRRKETPSCDDRFAGS